MESSTLPSDKVTDVTPEPTHTATQPTGAPSATPKEPDPRISTSSGVDAAAAGRGTEPVPTALSVDSSTTREPHSAVGCVDVEVVEVVDDGGPFVTVVDPAVPGGTTPGASFTDPGDEEALPPPAVALPVVPPSPCGVTGGGEHATAPVQP
jgi:hypothetical protein